MGCRASVSLVQQPISCRSSRLHDFGAEPSSATEGVVKPIILSAQQKTIVLRTWRILSSDLADRGVRVFLHIFDKNPRIKALFAYRDLVGEQLRRNHHFVSHAAKLLQAVGAVVENIDNCRDTVGPLLNSLGEQHTHFIGFHSVYFNDFEGAILEVFSEDLGPKFFLLAQDAWILVLNFILSELKRGYSLRYKGFQTSSQSTTTIVDCQSLTEGGQTPVEKSTNGRVAPSTAI